MRIKIERGKVMSGVVPWYLRHAFEGVEFDVYPSIIDNGSGNFYYRLELSEKNRYTLESLSSHLTKRAMNFLRAEAINSLFIECKHAKIIDGANNKIYSALLEEDYI